MDNYVAEQGNVCAFGYDVIKDPLPESTLKFPYNPDDGSKRKIGSGWSSFFK
jgi:hypothetical protein